MKEKLIYDWNSGASSLQKPERKLEFFDETLRDGLQSPSSKIPALNLQIKILHLMVKLGIGAVNIGYPGAGGKIFENTFNLAKVIAQEKIPLPITCTARTLIEDIKPVIEIAQKIGLPTSALIFIGSSPIRQYVQKWSIDQLCHYTQQAVSFAVQEGIQVLFFTEDTTRAHPDDLKKLYLTAIEAGATRIGIADTVGHITPPGITNLVTMIKGFLNDHDLNHIKIDFHGHMDRGLGVWNSISAFAAGVHRVHGCGLGIGERCGNTPMDQLLMNLKLMSWIDNDLSALNEYLHVISRAVGMPIPKNYPAIGHDAFATSSGIHAAAIRKAKKLHETAIADHVYSGVDAAEIGRKQLILIGPQSGRANVEQWLEDHHFAITDERVDKILAVAKSSVRVLKSKEILEIIHGMN